VLSKNVVAAREIFRDYFMMVQEHFIAYCRCREAVKLSHILLGLRVKLHVPLRFKVKFDIPLGHFLPHRKHTATSLEKSVSLHYLGK
jgi:hypothetical protein